RMRPESFLDTGYARHNGRRGVVIRYPRLHDYFRRVMARVSADQTPVPAADDPAAKLLSMVQCILASRREAHCRGRAAAPRGGDALAAKNPHICSPSISTSCCTTRASAQRELRRSDANEDACALDF